MKVSDEARLFAVREKLLDAERRLYEANQIIAHLFERNDNPVETLSTRTDITIRDIDRIDTVTGLYPGQIPDKEYACELPEEGQECVE